MSCFSTYYGHHLSTIEGGMICTDDEDIFNLLRSLRSHGWDRDMSDKHSSSLKKEFSIDNEFEAQYKFYYLGFNLRSTDLQAFIGINQLKRFDEIVGKRNENYTFYKSVLSNSYWEPPKSTEDKYISSFAYPVIHPNRTSIAKKLKEKNIASRPLICGSLGRQPFWTKNYGPVSLKNADKVNDFGFYLPNNHELEKSEINYIKESIKETW